MNSISSETIIKHTQKWVLDVVIGCNFCPFANKPYKKNQILFEVFDQSLEEIQNYLLNSFQYLELHPEIETSLLIFPNYYENFYDYLDLVEIAEKIVKKNGYKGVYQVASFHPDYLFIDADDADPANFTNRSPYPMIHIIREEGLSQAIDSYPNVEEIPNDNINFTRNKGLEYMIKLRDACMNL